MGVRFCNERGHNQIIGHRYKPDARLARVPRVPRGRVALADSDEHQTDKAHGAANQSGQQERKRGCANTSRVLRDKNNLGKERIHDCPEAKAST